MTLIQAIILGIVQGISEFLPISSSGHLYLTQTILGTQCDLGFFIWLHVGTLCAVIVYYRKSIISLFCKPFNKKLLYIVVASLPTFLIAACYKLFMPSEVERYLLPIGFTGTFVLLIVQSVKGKGSKPTELTTKKALIVGAVQGLAVIPGLSRSGSTIGTLCFMGIEREAAAEFSFLLSIPVILGGAAADILEFIADEQQLVFALDADIANKLVAVAVSAVVGLIALGLVEKMLNKGSFVKFALYIPVPLLLSLLLIL